MAATDETNDAPDPRRVLAARRIRLLESPLYLLLQPKPIEQLEAIVRGAIDGGVGIVQLLTEDSDDAQLIADGERLARLCHDHAVLFLINDRPELVNAIGADGVHLEADGASVARARDLIGPACLVGVSAPTAERLERAHADGADYASVGPVHETPLRPSEPVGYRAVHRSSLDAKLPWFAVGGIDAGNVERTLASGAERIVVARAIADADDPGGAARALRDAIDARDRSGASERRNAEARAALAPFAPGERPAPAAIAAILLAAIALTNLLMLLMGYQPRYELRTANAQAGLLAFGIVALAIAVGVWHLKAWALLLMEALLIAAAMTAFALLIFAQSLPGALVAALATGLTGWLFYRLIRVLARAQIPTGAQSGT